MNDKDRTNSWAPTAVGEVSALLRGITYNKEQSSKFPKPNFKPVLRANNINGTLNFDDLVFVPEELISVDQIIKAGDIIFAMSSGSKHLVGKSARARFDYDGSYGAFCALLRPCGSINRNYLYYIFQNNRFRRLISEVAKGSNINNLKREHILDFEIDLPPLPEQYRIVAKIEELFSDLDKGIENLKTARTQLKVYRQALLKHAFEGKLTVQWRAENRDKLETAEALQKRIQTERTHRYQQQLADWEAAGKQSSKPKAPKTLTPLTSEELAGFPEQPDGWGWIRLGNTNVDVSDGPFGSNLKSSDYVDGGVRVVRLENIGALKFIEEKESYVTEEKYELLKRHTVSAGDIVFSSFIVENIRVALMPPSIKKAINKADCFRVRFSGETFSNVFVVLVLSTRHVYKQLQSLIHGVGRPRINTTQLKDVVIPVCSSAEQQIIVAEIESRLSEIDQLELTITTSLQQADSLRQSILKKAFSGQLVPQDPKDEPAAALLARIKAQKATQVTTAKPA